MTDDIAVNQGWSAVGGRVLPPSSSRAGPSSVGTSRRKPGGELTGHVSFTTSHGLLGPGRRLRYRRAHWARYAIVWLAVVLLAPLAAGWAWGLLDGLAR